MKKNKTILTLTFILILTISVFSQNDSCSYRIDSLTNDKIYTSVEQPPTIGKTKKDLFDYIMKNFKIPNHYTEGELLIASFIVMEDGSLNQITLLKTSKYARINEHYLKFIKSMPNWTPGYCEEKIVKTEYLLPLRIGK